MMSEAFLCIINNKVMPLQHSDIIVHISKRTSKTRRDKRRDERGQELRRLDKRERRTHETREERDESVMTGVITFDL